MFLILLTGCVPVHSVSSLPGTYRFSEDYASAVLVLKNNGTYTEEYSPRGGSTQHCQGRWSWRAQAGKLELIGGVVLPPYVQRGMTSTNCMEAADIGVMRDMHGVYIEDDPDGIGQFYKVKL